MDICSHDENYMCPRCNECLLCNHTQKITDVIWWVCKDKTMIRIGRNFKIFEKIKPRI